MNLYIVMEDLGDGDIGLSYFSTEEIANKYIAKNQDWCYYESNPRYLKVDANFKFDDADAEVDEDEEE